MELTRRGFTRLAAGVAATPLLHAQRNIPIALELYSVREDCQKDFAASIQKVARMGYEGVEFAGYHGWKARDVAGLVRDNGLKVSSAHVGLNLLAPEKYQETIDYHQELGVKLLVVPYHKAPDAEAWKKFAGSLVELSAKLKAQGMQIGYHNHSHEMVAVDGQIPWEIIFDSTPKQVSHQADIGHMLRAGVDPVSYISKYAGRTATLHMKDYDPDEEDIILGEGKMDWQSVISACETVGGTEWYIIEQESYPYPPMECVERSLQALKKLLGRS
jgi:sugar phosphate isomerase/epimerase